MDFIVTVTKTGTVFEARTIIESGNPGGFRIEITGGGKTETFKSNAPFSMELLSNNMGIKSFFEKSSPELYTPWYNQAMATARRLQAGY